MTTVIHSLEAWLAQTETWIYNQVRYLPDDIANHVVCDRTLNLDQFPAPRLHSLCDASSLRYLWDKGLVKMRLRRHSGFLLGRIREGRADVVHSHFGNWAWRNLRTCEMGSARHVATFYGHDASVLPATHPKWRKRYQELFARIDRVLCEGPHMAGCVVGLGCPPEKVSVHHLGVALDQIPFRPREWVGTGPLKVLIAASFREKKGIPYALEAMGRLRSQVPFEITIIGDANTTPASQAEKARILATLERSGLATGTRLLGYQTHRAVFEQAYRHHIFLSPSVTASDGDTEGGAPVALIEMAATGMPVVSSRHCDIPEVVRDGETGLLAEERDVDGLVQCLDRLLSNPGTWRDMAEAARTHLEREFDARRQAEKLAEIYRAMAA